jgi:siderophore synthetase component
MTARPLSIEEAAATAGRRTIDRLLRCALSERLFDIERSVSQEAGGAVRHTLETAAGTLQLRCRPPFTGWRHADLDGPLLCACGSDEHPLENPLELIALLRSLHPDGRWDLLRDEIGDSLRNETMSIRARSERDHAIAEAARDSGCPTLPEWIRRSLPATGWTSFLEQWGAVGHPHHPCAKTRIGFTAQDSLRYAPEFGARIDVPWAAVRRDRLAVEAVTPDLDAAAFLAGYFPAAMERWRRAVAASGADPEAYLPLAVHPWQWREVVVSRFAEEIARGDLLKPDGVETGCLAMLSLRTLAPIDPADGPCLKLPLSIQVTSSRRELGPAVVAAGPWMTRRLEATLERDGRLRRSLAVLGEPLGLHIRPAHPGDGRSGMLSVLLRGPVADLLRPGEIAIPVAALFVPSPVSGQPLFLELAAAAGEGVAAFFGDYCDVVLGAFLRLSLLHGIALEAHQQNSLVVVDERQRIARIVARDFGARVLADSIDPSDPVPGAAREMVVADRDALREMVSHAVLESHVRELVALLARHRALPPATSWSRVRTAIEDVLGGLADELDAGTLEDERAALFGRPWRVKSLLRMRIAEDPGDSFIDTRNPFAPAS